MAQVHRALLVVVEQTARGGHQNIHAAAQCVDLGIHAHTAENDHGAQRQVFRISADTFLDLGSEFTRWRENQRADAAGLLGAWFTRARHQMEQRQGKPRSFARAGLCASKEIGAAEHRGNGLQLDRRRRFIAGFRNCFQNRLSQSQIFERHDC